MKEKKSFSVNKEEESLQWKDNYNKKERREWNRSIKVNIKKEKFKV